MRNQGFTLIELMVVLGITGVLASIAIPQYQEYLVRTQLSEGIVMAQTHKVQAAEYFASRGLWPTDNAEAGLELGNQYQGNYVASITINSAAAIDVTYGNRVHDDINSTNGNVLSIRAAENSAGGLVWLCGYATPTGNVTFLTGSTNQTTVLPRYLPADCRA